MRPVRRRDLGLLAAWRADPENARCFFSPRPPTRGGQAAWYRALLADRRKMVFVIEADDGAPVGTIGLDRIDRDHGSAELGNVLIGQRARRGKGLADDAVRALAAFAFDGLGLNRLYLEVYRWNTPAIRLYAGVGFVTEGVLRQHRRRDGVYRDTVLMGLLRGELPRRGGRPRAGPR